jgi:hypothetical protein
MQELAERVEYSLQDFRIEFYKSDYETTTFSPLHYISSEPITYSDDETKGLTLMTFRIFYTRIS